MNQKINITSDTYFNIEKAKENLLTDDDVILSVFIGGKQYCVVQDSYLYEVRHMLNYFFDSANFVEMTAGCAIVSTARPFVLSLSKDWNQKATAT